MMRYLFGEVARVYAQGSTGLMKHVPNYDVEDVSAVTNMSAIFAGTDSFDQDILKQLEATNPDGTDYSDRDNMRNEFMIGTVETVRQQVEAFKQRGVSHFMLWFMDFPQTKSMERFAQNILQ